MGAPSISRTQRLLDLLAYLAGRRTPVTADRILADLPAYADRWRDGDETERASVRRAFERDKRDLREMGIPLRTASFTVDYGGTREEGYRLPPRDFYLPYLRLLRRGAGGGADDAGERSPRTGDGARARARNEAAGHGPGELELSDDEARLALEALRRLVKLPGSPLAREARSALRKLTFDLDPTLLPETPLTFVPPPGESGDTPEARSELLRRLTDALLSRTRISFPYHSIGRDRTGHRTVEPYGLFFQHGRWYLAGRDLDRDDLRVFRADRMREVEPASTDSAAPDYEVPDGFDPDDLLGREAWELGSDGEEDAEAMEVEVRFRHPTSRRMERKGLGTPVEEADDGSSVRSFTVRRKGPFLRWLLSLAGEAEVVEPPELRKELRTLARETEALYGETAAEVRGTGPAPPPARRPVRGGRSRTRGRADGKGSEAAARNPGGADGGPGSGGDP